MPDKTLVERIQELGVSDYTDDECMWCSAAFDGARTQHDPDCRLREAILIAEHIEALPERWREEADDWQVIVPTKASAYRDFADELAEAMKGKTNDA